MNPAGMVINEYRIAFIRRDTHDPPKPRRFMIVLRFIARIMIHHQASILSKVPRRQLPSGKSPFITECASSDFPQRSRANGSIAPHPSPCWSPDRIACTAEDQTCTV